MGRFKRIRHGLTYWGVRLLTGALNRVPRRLAMGFGSFLGLAMWAALPRDRYRFRKHLGYVYGDALERRTRDLWARSFFVNSGRNLVDVLRFRRHFEREIKPRVRVEGMEHFERAHGRGRGVLGVTGHLGNFELLAAYIQSIGYPSAVIGRRMYDRRLDAQLVANREAMGLTNISTEDSPRILLKWLKAGNVIGVLIDFDSISVRSEFVPVFGRPALTPIGQSVIGLRAEAAFVPIACVRDADDSYRIVIEPEITIEPSGDLDRDVIAMTAACSRGVERLIARFPDQWAWFKNRWLTPPGYTA